MSDKICLFDMDNTLFSYEEKLREDFRKLMSPGEIEPEELHDENNTYIKARIDLIKSQPGWWRCLPRFQLGWDLFGVARDIGFTCRILTKGPRSKTHAWTEKVQCIQDHFGTEIGIDIVGESKSGTYGRVLVDDYPNYVLEWLEYRPRGLAILPAHKYNEDLASHPNCIRYDGTNLDTVRCYLQAAFERSSGEHWREYIHV